MKKSFVFLFFACFFLPVSGSLITIPVQIPSELENIPSNTKELVHSDLEKSIVQIVAQNETKTHAGTAFHIGASRFVTNAHIFYSHLPEEKYIVRKPLDPQSNLGRSAQIKKILHLDLKNDLAVFEIQTQKSSQEFNQAYPPIPIKFAERFTEALSAKPDTSFFIGYPQFLLSQFSFKKILPESKQQFYIPLNTDILKGASGSPVFYKDQIIGILKSNSYNFAQITHINELVSLLKQKTLTCSLIVCMQKELKKIKFQAKLNNQQAQMALATYYRKKREQTKVVKWFKKALTKDNFTSLASLSYIYLQEPSYIFDEEKLIQKLKESSEKDKRGVLDYLLGQIMLSRNDLAEAVFWFNKSGLKGHFGSWLHLANIYESFHGIEKSEKIYDLLAYHQFDLGLLRKAQIQKIRYGQDDPLFQEIMFLLKKRNYPNRRRAQTKYHPSMLKSVYKTKNRPNRPVITSR